MTRRVAPIVALALSAAAVIFANPYVRGDGNGYYAWAASAIVDGDLDFANQYAHADPLFRQRYLDESGAALAGRVTATSHLEDQWAIGPAVLWSPFLMITHVAARAAGVDADAGFAPVYRRVVATATVLYALAGLWLSVSAARRLGASPDAAIVSAAAIALATPWLVYACFLPFHVHALAAFTVALFFWFPLTREMATASQWLWWGAIAGLMAMTYHVDAVLAVAALPAASRAVSWRTAIGRLVLFGAAAIVAATPQWVGKAIVFGSPLTTGYQDRFYFLSPHFAGVLFAPDHGLILWTPIVALGLAGLWRIRRHRAVAAMLAAAAIFSYVIASYQNWDGLSSFGNRFFVSLTLPLVVGLSVLVSAAWRHGAAARACAGAVLALLVTWNVGLVVQWGAKMLPNRGAVDFRQAARQQAEVPAQLLTLVRRYFTAHDDLIRELEAKDTAEHAAGGRGGR